MTPDRAAELIAMLTAKVERFEPAIATFGALQRYDIVHAIALVKSLPAQMLVRIKYANEVSNIKTFDDQFAAAIEREFTFSTVSQLAAPQRWKVPRKDFLRNMCRLAIVECLAPNLCWHCEGHRGSLDVSGKWHDCHACNASGFKAASARKRAKILGIHEAAWKMSWAERYKAIQAVLDRYEAVGLGGVAKRLSA